MKINLIAGIILFLLTSCTNNVDKMSNHEVRVDNVSSSSSPKSSSIASEAKKEDDSVRAIGTHPDGRLLIRPVSKADKAPLGASSEVMTFPSVKLAIRGIEALDIYLDEKRNRCL